MEEKKLIELTPIETTAYWWVTMIRYKIRELIDLGAANKKEVKFVEKFYNCTERDWRNIYLGLVSLITEDVNNFKTNGVDDSFCQDTSKGGHNRLNEELKILLKYSIPDIRLASTAAKDSIIYTNSESASVWYKSCGVSELPYKYENDYILTGDEEELDFYNLVISTIIILNNQDNSFRSTIMLRKIFCEEFKKINNLTCDLNEILNKFNRVFEKAGERNILLGKVWDDTYYTVFKNIDLVGLQDYMATAQYYAFRILAENKRNNGESYTKRIEKKQ